MNDLKTLVRHAKQAGKLVGLVPTMGYLHEGHLTLMRQARGENSLVVASIFVNPLQFGPSEDYAAYPRNFERDSRLAAAAGVDILFVPEVAEMYPHGAENMLTMVEVHHISDRLCGESRRGHFRGVATVVCKLFNLVEPDAAYFGQKDAQQVVVIKRMVEDLNMNLRIVVVPIVREPDGLAMSSRNVYLDEKERQAALVLYEALMLAKEKLTSGLCDAEQIVRMMSELIGRQPLAKIDYISISDSEMLDELAVVDRPVLIALAVRIGQTRLIDNMLWEG